MESESAIMVEASGYSSLALSLDFDVFLKTSQRIRYAGQRIARDL